MTVSHVSNLHIQCTWQSVDD